MDAVVDNVFIPVITDGHLCTTDERRLLSLPVKKGGLAIPILSTMAEFQFANSRAATEQLVEHIYYKTAKPQWIPNNSRPQEEESPLPKKSRAAVSYSNYVKI